MTVDSVLLRYSSTSRSSDGIARTTITPDWRLITTLRPGASPTSVLTSTSIAPQKSESVRVSTAVPLISLCVLFLSDDWFEESALLAWP